MFGINFKFPLKFFVKLMFVYDNVHFVQVKFLYENIFILHFFFLFMYIYRYIFIIKVQLLLHKPFWNSCNVFSKNFCSYNSRNLWYDKSNQSKNWKTIKTWRSMTVVLSGHWPFLKPPILFYVRIQKNCLILNFVNIILPKHRDSNFINNLYSKTYEFIQYPCFEFDRRVRDSNLVSMDRS